MALLRRQGQSAGDFEAKTKTAGCCNVGSAIGGLYNEFILNSIYIVYIHHIVRTCVYIVFIYTYIIYDILYLIYDVYIYSLTSVVCKI